MFSLWNEHEDVSFTEYQVNCLKQPIGEEKKGGLPLPAGNPLVFEVTTFCI